MNKLETLKSDKDLKTTLQKLHIDYVNFCASVSKDPALAFWGINNFKDYVTQFGWGHESIRMIGMTTTLDKAAEIGYTLDE